VIKRYQEQGSVKNKPRTGRKKKLSVQDEQSILRLVKTQRVEPLTEKYHCQIQPVLGEYCFRGNCKMMFIPK
jgi:transposase